MQYDVTSPTELKVSAFVEKTFGVATSFSYESHAAAQIDEILEAWHNRPLEDIIYVALDAHYEKVQLNGQVRDVAVLIAKGVDTDGKRHILGISVSQSERESHWRSFLESLAARGMKGVRLILSDDHAGFAPARLTVFGDIPWQRCH